MSTLKLHQPCRLSVYPPEEAHGEDGPVILRFPKLRRRSAVPQATSLVQRIQVIRKNRFCPSCGKAHVQPISSGTALLSRDAMPIPGTGELVGFQCLQCSHAWRA